LISGKRNDVVDSGIVEADGSGALGSDERKFVRLRDPRAAFRGGLGFDATKD